MTEAEQKLTLECGRLKAALAQAQRELDAVRAALKAERGQAAQIRLAYVAARDELRHSHERFEQATGGFNADGWFNRDVWLENPVRELRLPQLGSLKLEAFPTGVKATAGIRRDGERTFVLYGSKSARELLAEGRDGIFRTWFLQALDALLAAAKP